MNQTYSEIDVDEEPIMVLPCGCVVTAASLDHIMELDKFYEMDDSGEHARATMPL